MIRRFQKNTRGKDYVVGDIHGHFSRLMLELDNIGFDRNNDRLFSVGDLVDRGPENLKVVDLLATKWFHAVRGNHEELVIESFNNDFRGPIAETHVLNGGMWFHYIASYNEQSCVVAMLKDLPMAIEIETANGIVGLVHAECPYNDWNLFAEELEKGKLSDRSTSIALWSRNRIYRDDETPVAGIDYVVVGHTPVVEVVRLGNVIYTDTCGWGDGEFSVLDIETLSNIK